MKNEHTAIGELHFAGGGNCDESSENNKLVHNDDFVVGVRIIKRGKKF